MNKDTLKQYFNLLEDTLIKRYPLDPQTPRIVREQEKYNIRALEKGQITVVACGNAAGQVLPPLIIFDAIIFDAKNIRQAG